MSLYILVLGSAAGGGVPQWNCRCPVCDLARRRDGRVRWRGQAGLAVSTDGKRWLLLDASPDLRQQILAAPALQPTQAGRQSPIAGVFLTNGDIDHVAGLLSLRERQPLTIYGSAATLDLIASDAVFGVLDRSSVRFAPATVDTPVETELGLVVKAFAVPGKVPLYRETGEVAVGEETEGTLGLEVAGGGSRFLYVPGCAAITPALRARLAGAPLLFFDGTTFTDDEMPRLGLSDKTARRMGHVAMSGREGSLAGLADLAIGRRIYIHINNTNPVLIEDSAERRAVTAAGWEVAFDGMEVVA